MPGEEIRFLTRDEVLFIHDELTAAFGGANGLRDAGLLESALYRPRTGYYADLIEMAAALFESLLMIHAFVDGNKRIAFFGVDTFLRINGFRIDVPADTAHSFLIRMLEQHSVSKDRLEDFLRQYARPLDP